MEKTRLHKPNNLQSVTQITSFVRAISDDITINYTPSHVCVMHSKAAEFGSDIGKTLRPVNKWISAFNISRKTCLAGVSSAVVPLPPTRSHQSG